MSTPGEQLDAYLTNLNDRVAALESAPDAAPWEDTVDARLSNSEARLSAFDVTLANINQALSQSAADVALLRAQIAKLSGVTPPAIPPPVVDPPVVTPPVVPPTVPVLPVDQAQFTVINAAGLQQQATGTGATQWIQPAFYWPADGDMTPFVGGDAYMRMHVRKKPSDLLVAAQFCMWNQTNGGFDSYEETCSPWRSAMFTEPGVYYVKWRPPVSWYQAPQGPRTPVGVFPWDRRPHVARLFMKPVLNKDTGLPAVVGDTNIDGSKLLANRNAGSSKWDVSDAEIARHLPISVDFDVIFTREGQPFRPPATWVDHPWDAGAPVTPPVTQPPIVVQPPVVPPTEPPVMQPPTGTGRRLPAHLRGVFAIHGEQWPSYRQQVAKLDPVLANRMAKYNFGTLNNRRARFDTAPEGWTTGDTLDLMRQQWNTTQFGFKLQLPVSKVKYTGAGQPNEAHVDVPVEAWRPTHPQHQAAKTWLTQFGGDIRQRQQAGQLVDPLPVTLMHENLGSYAFILGHTVNPRSAVEWKVTGTTLPHTPTDYAGFFRFAADTIRDTGAKILAVYSPNAVRLDTQPLAAACVAAIGEDYLDCYGMSAYHHSANQMASAEGFERIGVKPSPAQLVQSLEGNCQFIRELTDAPIMVNEFGFNPTRSHKDDKGNPVVTNAAPVEHLIPDYFETAARFDIGQMWYFNADKIGGKEAFDILDDGNGTEHDPATARIFVTAARKWSDAVRA